VLIYPFQGIVSYWLPLTALSYYILYGHDLAISHYRWRDLPRIYALNLLLIPINLGGVAKSIQQWWTGRPSAFVRTPKVTGRTAAPTLYIVMCLAIPVYTILVAIARAHAGNWTGASWPLLNALASGYAFARFIGPRQAWEDLAAGLAMRGLHGRKDRRTRELSPPPNTFPPKRILSGRNIRCG
jgi:hypothetical protein